MKTVERFEDMSPRGRLRLTIQPDGDVIVTIVPDPDGGERMGYMKSVEFTTPGGGGGGSERTHRALRALYEAMIEDNKAVRGQGRRGEIGEGGSENAKLRDAAT